MVKAPLRRRINQSKLAKTLDSRRLPRIEPESKPTNPSNEVKDSDGFVFYKSKHDRKKMRSANAKLGYTSMQIDPTEIQDRPTPMESDDACGSLTADSTSLPSLATATTADHCNNSSDLVSTISKRELRQSMRKSSTPSVSHKSGSKRALRNALRRAALHDKLESCANVINKGANSQVPLSTVLESMDVVDSVGQWIEKNQFVKKKRKKLNKKKKTGTGEQDNTKVEFQWNPRASQSKAK